MMLSKPPEKIYLQFYGDGEPDEEGNVDDEDVTWCINQIFTHDVEFVRNSEINRSHRIEEAAKALIKCKGLYHTEYSMSALVDAVNLPIL